MFAAIEWRMKIQTEQNKPHKKQTSIAHDFTVSFTIIISGVTIVYIGIIQMYEEWIWISQEYMTVSNWISNSRSPNQYRSPSDQLPDVQPTQKNSDS